MLIESVLLTYCIKMGEHCLAVKRCTLLTSFVIRVTPKLVAIRSLTILKSFSPLVLRGTFPPLKPRNQLIFLVQDAELYHQASSRPWQFRTC